MAELKVSKRHRPGPPRPPSSLLRKQSDLETTFSALARQWREETGPLSSVSKKAMHPAYQRIIGLGPQAVPLILRELEARPGDWLWALAAITGEDPVQPAHNFQEAVAIWLEWGRQHGYL